MRRKRLRGQFMRFMFWASVGATLFYSGRFSAKFDGSDAAAAALYVLASVGYGGSLWLRARREDAEFRHAMKRAARDCGARKGWEL